MPFDPSQPFVLESDGVSERFDPSKPFEILDNPPQERGVSLRAVAPPPSEAIAETRPSQPRPVTQAFPAREQVTEEGVAMGEEQRRRTAERAETQTKPLAQLQAEVTGIAQPESEIQPIGEEGSVLRGVSSVAAAVLNRPEYLAALAHPATAVAVGAAFAPVVAKQFFEDLGEAIKGDNEAFGRAAAIGVPALIGGVKAGRTITKRLEAQTQLERMQKASSAAHIDAMARLEMNPRLMPERPTSPLPLSQAELNKFPGGPNAFQERSATTPDVEKASGDSAKVGAREPEPEPPSVSQDVNQQQPQPAAKGVGAVRDVAELPPIKMLGRMDPLAGVEPELVAKIRENAAKEGKMAAVEPYDLFEVEIPGTGRTSIAEPRLMEMGYTKEQIDRARSEFRQSKEVKPNEEVRQEGRQEEVRDEKVTPESEPAPVAATPMGSWGEKDGVIRQNPEGYWERLDKDGHVLSTDRSKEDLMGEWSEGSAGYSTRIVETRPGVFELFSRDEGGAEPIHELVPYSNPQLRESLPPTSAAGGGAGTAAPNTEAPPPKVEGAGAASRQTVTGFKTAKGSTYEVRGQSTTRNKTPHEGHDPNDVGLKPPSERTIYVDPETAEDVAFHTGLNAEAKPKVFIEGDKLVRTSRYGKGWEKEKRMEHSFSTEPQVGWVPIEFWKGKIHVGNTITELFQSEAKSAPVQASSAAAKQKRPGVERPPDIIDFILERFGGIRGKKHARPGSEGYYSSGYDEARAGAGRQLFRASGQSPDEVLDGLRREGYMGQDATVDDLWTAIGKANRARRAHFRGETPEAQADKFHRALQAQAKQKGSHTVSVGDLSVGDKFVIGKEQFEVLSIDPDTGEVSVRDGRKFGHQTIPDGADIPVEKGSYQAKPIVVEFTGEDFSLNAPESVEQQKARLGAEEAKAKAKAEREQMEEQASKPLVGSRGDIGQKDMFGGGDMFSQEPIGMGGAVPSEFVPSSEGATAMKYRRIDAERVKRGLEPLTKPESVADQIVMDRAMAAIDADPYLPDKLIAELTENPRAIQDWENHVLLLRKIDLRNEYAKATRDIQQAAADNRLEDVRIAQERRAEWSAKLTQLEIASRLAGTERGRALRALRVMANEDYSLAAMEAEMSADRGGRPITDAERAKLRDIERRYNQAQGKIKELEEVAKQREEVLKQSELGRLAAEAQAAYDPRVLQVAERFAGYMDKKAADAATRLKEKLRNLGAGVDPTILADVTVMAAAKITRGAVDFAKWSAELTKEFGEAVKPYLQEAWDAAKIQVAKELEVWAKPLDKPTKDKVKKTVAPEAPKPTGAPGTPPAKPAAEPPVNPIEDLTGKLRAKIEKNEAAEIHPIARRLFRAVVEENPLIGREEALTRVHDIVREVLPDITRQETSDAITGRGRFWQAPQDQVSKTVRDLSTQLRLASHQQDVIARKPLPRTGYQPDPFSDAARREQQILNELKRRFGVVVTDPTKQLASALNARKTYYRNRLADLRAEIASRKRTVETKTPPPTDAELTSLREEYARVKAEHDAIFGDKKLTDEQRLKLAIAAAERNVAEWNQRVENAKRGKFGPIRTPGSKVTSPQLEALRAQAEALREEVQELKDLDPAIQAEKAARALQAERDALEKQIAEKERRLATGDLKAKGVPLNRPAVPELEGLKQRRDALNKELAQARKGPAKSRAELALQAYKTRTANQIAKLKAQIASGDFAKKAPTPVAMDKAANALKHELELVKEARNEAMIQARLRDEGPVRKAFRWGQETLNLARAVFLGIDFSAVLNQGKFMVVSHPFRAAKSIVPMFRAWASPKAAFAELQKIKERPNYPMYKASKLFLHEPGSTLSAMEEAYMGRWVRKVPLLSRFEASYVTFLNKLRADSFDAMARSFTGGKPTVNEAKVISNMINQFTGRGHLGVREGVGVGANAFFLAPRFVASRFQTALGQPLYHGLISGTVPLKGTVKARALVAKEYAHLLMGYAVLYTLAAAAGYKIGTDIFSSDFGKIIDPDDGTRIDPLAGVSQVTVFTAREAAGQTTTGSGKTLPLRGDGVKFGGPTGASVFGQFLRSKLAPFPAAVLDAASGKDIVDRPTTPGKAVLDHFAPLTGSDIWDVMQKEDFPEAAGKAVLILFGERIRMQEEREKAGGTSIIP